VNEDDAIAIGGAAALPESQPQLFSEELRAASRSLR